MRAILQCSSPWMWLHGVSHSLNLRWMWVYTRTDAIEMPIENGISQYYQTSNANTDDIFLHHQTHTHTHAAHPVCLHIMRICAHRSELKLKIDIPIILNSNIVCALCNEQQKHSNWCWCLHVALSIEIIAAANVMWNAHTLFIQCVCVCVYTWKARYLWMWIYHHQFTTELKINKHCMNWNRWMSPCTFIITIVFQ